MTRRLADYAAAQLRAELARRNLPASALARTLGENESWVRKRMRGVYGITMDDLDRIATALDVSPTFFIAPEREVVAA